MAFNSQITLTLIGNQGGQRCVNVMYYFKETAVSTIASISACNAFYSDVWPDLQAMLHQNYILERIEAVIYQIPGSLSKPGAILPVNEAGTVTTGDVMPPFVTVRLIKQVDNTTLDPVAADNFRNGYSGFAGIPEGQVSSGFLESAYVAGWNTFGESLEVLTVDDGASGTVDYDLGLLRYPSSTGSGSDKVLVAETDVSTILGTRNSRKF